MKLVIGIDPGSRITGFGIVGISQNRYKYIDSGCIKTGVSSDIPAASRLKIIYSSVSELINKYKPYQMAIEQVFVNKNVQSALKLGQARGVAMLAASMDGIPVFEYAPRKIKQAIVGTGAADKKQMQHMVTSILQLSSQPQEDAADALAIAICHLNTQKYSDAVLFGR
jgi:crossover junction endodeoxyribonuclease RuvC